MQWKWRCTFRDAYYVCRLLWPYAHTKLPKIEQIIDHYADEENNNIVDFERHRLFAKSTGKIQ